MKEIEITLGHATQILNNLTRDKYSEEQIAKSTKHSLSRKFHKKKLAKCRYIKRRRRKI